MIAKPSDEELRAVDWEALDKVRMRAEAAGDTMNVDLWRSLLSATSPVGPWQL